MICDDFQICHCISCLLLHKKTPQGLEASKSSDLLFLMFCGLTGQQASPEFTHKAQAAVSSDGLKIASFTSLRSWCWLSAGFFLQVVSQIQQTSWPPHRMVGVLQDDGNRSLKVPEDLASEVSQYHFCCIPWVKAISRVNSNSRGREKDSTPVQ